MRNPAATAMKAFSTRNFTSRPAGTCREIMMGSISSEVERKTASNVPIVMIRPAYRLAATVEKPHWGTTPSRPPTRGPKRPAFFITASVCPSRWCSRYSIARYVK